ncbi:hypothetical protein WA026_005040 [Henosepilachna vigintioctopunctata]|uniref:Uncharacterized protein n=1 Tax=Henosepilachna vigintioctopunctata TaxID=420089 RepID=A0AAW1USS5_9CUCU
MKWCEGNQIKLNMDKTEAMFYQTNRSSKIFPDTLLMKDGEITVCSSAKFLGIYIDQNMRWDTHCTSLSKRLHSVIYTLNVLRDKLAEPVLKLIYSSNFVSQITYGIIFWGNSGFSNKIFVDQKWAIRTIFHLKRRTSCRGIFRKHGYMTLIGLYIYKCLMFVQQNRKLFMNYEIHSNTRKMDYYFLPKCRLALTQNQVEFMCLKLYNRLPRGFCTSSEDKHFKNRLRKFIIECEPYTVDEFYEYCSSVV